MDKGKLLLFIKDKVTSCAPRRGHCLNTEKECKSKGKDKRRAESPLQLSQLYKRQRGGPASTSTSASANTTTSTTASTNTSTSALPVLEGEDDESCSDLVLIYNTIRDYYSTINELWVYQTSLGLYSTDWPQRVTPIALKTSITRGQYQRYRNEFEDRGLATIRDGYIATQILDLTRAVWNQSLDRSCTE